MDIKKTALLGLGLLWVTLSFAQTSTPFSWQRMVLPTTPQAITMKNGLLYAHTPHETFSSNDFGDTWQPAQRHINATFVAYNATDFVYLMPPIRWNGAYPTFSSLWNGHLFGSSSTINGFSRFTTGTKGSTGEKLFLSDADILNDGTLLYNKQNIVYSNIMGYSSTTYNKKGVLFSDDRPILDDAPSNVFGHLDTFFLQLNHADSQLSFMGDTSFVVYNEKPIPLIGLAKIDSDSTIYVLAENGKYAHSTDLGDTWTIDSVPFTGISSYQIHQSIHTFKVNDTTIVSKDLSSFHILPQGYHHFIFKDLIIAYKDLHTWIRSFNDGATWQDFDPFGISTTMDNTLKLYEDTLYVESEGKLFKQTCIDRFDISLNNLFLLSTNQYNMNSSTTLSDQPGSCNNCNFKYFEAGDFFFANGEYGNYHLNHKNYYRQKSDSIWHDISSNIPFWEPRYKNQFYFNVYSFSRAYSNIYYHPTKKSFYVSTSESGLNRTSVGMVAPDLVAIKELTCSVPDTAFFIYQTCQPDTLAISQQIINDTLFVAESCGPDTIDYQGNVYTFSGTYIIDTTKNYLGCDSIYHKIILIDHSAPPVDQFTNDFLCLGDTLHLNNMVLTNPGTYPYDTITNSYGCDSIFLSLNLDGPIIDTVEMNAEIGAIIVGVEIAHDTVFTDTIWSSANGCESAFHTYIIHLLTATFEMLSTDIRTYPNPTNGTLFIDHIPNPISKVYVTNILGNRVYYIDKIGSNVEIDVSLFPEGVYMLHLADNHNHTWHRPFSVFGN